MSTPRSWTGPRVVAWCGAALLVLATIGRPAAADGVSTAETDGTGTLTMCRSWILWNSCQSYNHVAVPPRLVVGDRIVVVFGTNTKRMEFPVAQIDHEGDRCTVFADGNFHDPADAVDKIEVIPCRAAPGAR